MGDHYLTLGVGRVASEREIARAYRRLARRYHPDVSTAPAVTLELFLAVQQAYETLGDSHRRAAYDMELRRSEQPSASPPMSGTVDAVRPAGRPTAVRVERPAPSTQPSTTALSLVIASAILLPVSLLLGDALSGGSRFLWAGAGSLLALAGSSLARSLAARQLEYLWRWTATGGRSALRRSEAARTACRRIQLADDVTLFGRRLVLFGVPIVFLLVRR
jgi:hypothetical protein